MDLTPRWCTVEDWPALAYTDGIAFGAELPQERIDGLPALLDAGRFNAIDDDGEIAGLSGSIAFELTLPGGSIVPASGITWVGVRPTHRRRGLLTALMAHQLQGARDRGEPVAVLLASQAPIYGRFGFGEATEWRRVNLELARTRFVKPAPDLHLRLLDGPESRPILQPLWDEWRLLRPGGLSRSDAWWDRNAQDPEYLRDGHGPLRRVVARERAGRDVGYATYRVEQCWEPEPGNHKVHVDDLVALTDDAHHALWQFVASIDLASHVDAYHVAPDDPLPFLLVDRRAAQVSEVSDGMWLCPLDVALLLRTRAYDADVDPTVIEVDGERYRFGVRNGVGDCEPTDAEPVVRMPRDTLGAILLGGQRLRVLASAGRASTRSPDALAALDRAFAWPIQPLSSTHF